MTFLLGDTVKTKVLCILHRSPPVHGAAKVGDFIANSEKFTSEYDCKFITIKSSNNLTDIGNISFTKIYYIIELYIKVFWALLLFSPNKVYFTSSVKGVAFFRDLLLSSLWKSFKLFKKIDVYYHYHTTGINDFVSAKAFNLLLTDFFIKGVNIILLSPMLKNDLIKVTKYKEIFYLPNGIKDNFSDVEFKVFINDKFRKPSVLNVLFLSNMLKSKGYFNVLELALKTKGQEIHYDFAGAWESDSDRNEFFDFIQKNDLSESITFHGFVSGENKRQLFEKASCLIFPTRHEAFGLVVIEALAYGLPVIATNEGSIPYILNEKCGVVIHSTEQLLQALKSTKQKLINKETAMYCRQRYLNNFSSEQFERNLVEVFKAS
jgi:glycosyltransferase involved in cell wall biosynthesis